MIESMIILKRFLYLVLTHINILFYLFLSSFVYYQQRLNPRNVKRSVR